jgi:hypothetical protein
MVLSDQQKAAMRERMEAVRNAKKSKKEAVAAVVAPAPVAAPEQPKPKPLPQAKRVPKPIADEVLEKVMPSAPKLKPVNTELVEISAEADDEPVPSATPRVAKIPQARFAAAEPKKEKFAKLVFYKEPNAKQQSKLTKILQEEESSDEEKPVIVSKVAAANDSMETYQQQHEQKLKRMQAMASKFF